MSGGEFLSRWSRRKLQSEPEAPAADLPAPVPAEAPGETAPPDAPQESDALTPEEIEALPKVEEITAETDITMFLRKGVPEFLKNAALRRVWSVDPTIRDYVSEAREYAYDWNVPGGVPGNGPLLPSDNVGDMLRQIFGDGPPGTKLAESMEAEAARGAVSRIDGRSAAVPSEEAPPEPDADAAAQQDDEGLGPSPEPDPLNGKAFPAMHPVRLDAPPIAAPPPEPEPAVPQPARVRRHGGAKPV
ncbi:MAG TPA: DUF3306 domain-containing protein [Microvirga sp.]|jgi:hypothetical protein